MLPFLSSFYLFVLGVSLGSFLNVLVDRLPKNETIIKGRSHCDHCRHKLHWIDLIPIVSYVLLGGKCRYCHAHISLFYPFVELVTGTLFIFLFFSFLGAAGSGSAGQFPVINNFALVYYLIIISLLIVIFFTDLKYGIIPDKIVYSGIFITFFYLIVNSNSLILSNVLSAVFAFAFFFLVFIITHGKGMGFGDVKLVFLLGLMLGFPKIVVALYVAFLLGALIAILLIIIKRKKFYKDTIPFGPFLVIGTILALFAGDIMLKNYMAFLIW